MLYAVNSDGTRTPYERAGLVLLPQGTLLRATYAMMGTAFDTAALFLACLGRGDLYNASALRLVAELECDDALSLESAFQSMLT